MIGVIVDPAEQETVREFFELFKTPWEFFRPNEQYEILLCVGDGHLASAAKLVLCYAGRKTELDEEQKTQIRLQQSNPRILFYRGNQIPIYGTSVTFSEKRSGLLTDKDSHECAAYLVESKGGVLARIGYDLFAEIRMLLTSGQPPANAHIPALELHIAFLRNLIISCGISLVEIPPVPNGYPFVACLTHDVDHPSIRQHKVDHTILGFLHRAIFGSLLNLIRARMPVRDVIRNWVAVLKLPFVYCGLAKDFWCEFEDRYLELEGDLSSTFFVIPFKNYAGKTSQGTAPMFRAASYEAKETAASIQKLLDAGCEVGLHGIDAWLDSSRGRKELEEIQRLTGIPEIGVRMHWLYHDQRSPVALEKAGAAYDSTIGYNQTVGYRAGTTQAYKPFGVQRLLELPMHAMDTALFYPVHLGLSPRDASALLRQMVDNAAHFGGCLTVNWHDRSVVPERLWGACYCDLLRDLKGRDPWFATAGQAVSWFRKRRAAKFEVDCVEPGRVGAKVTVDRDSELPGLRLRIHKAQESGGMRSHDSEDYIDLVVEENVGTGVRSGAGR